MESPRGRDRFRYLGIRCFGIPVERCSGLLVSRCVLWSDQFFSRRIFLSRSTSSRSLPIRRSFWAMTVATGIEDFRSGIRRGSV